MSNKIYDCVIIGSGSAGCTAAIYVGMSNLSCIMITGTQPGGIIITTSIVDNYPGIPGISGNDLGEKYLDHAKKYSDIEYSIVLEIRDHGNTKIVVTDKSTIECRGIIICSGSSYKKMPQLQNNVNYCAYCDGFLFKNQKVVVVGGGNSAFESANYLSGICESVTILHRSSIFKAFQYLLDTVQKKNNIQIIPDAEIEHYDYENKIIKLTNTNKTLYCDGVFVCIGMLPNTSFIPSNISLDPHSGHIIVDKYMRTSCNGIYAAGDVVYKKFKQITSAVAEATAAALQLVEDLRL